MRFPYKPFEHQSLQTVIIFSIVNNLIFSGQSKSLPPIKNVREVNESEPGHNKLPLIGSLKKYGTVKKSQGSEDHEWKSAESVVLTQVIFRHGDRSATHTYPTDPHVSDWVDGLGQLSKTGMMQAYELGQYLRQRYRNLISEKFRKDEVYVRSTNYERTLMSAECVCAGLFPVNASYPDLSEVLNHWQPVPIQTVPSAEDKLLHPADTCDYVHLLKDGILAMDVSSDHIINDKNLMYKLSHSTGMEINVNSLHDLADTLFCQLEHNMSQPDWMTKDIQEKLLKYGLHRPHTGPTDVKYLSGTLLDTVIENMKSKAGNISDFRKMYLYSAHDSTVAPLMSILGVDNFLQVPYSAAFIIELHLIHSQYFVKLLYRNFTGHPPHTLIAERCELKLCPLKVFDGMHRTFILSDDEWNAVCPDSSGNSLQIDERIFPVLLGAIVALIGVSVFSCYKAYSYKLQMRQGSNQDQYGLVHSATDSDDEDEHEHDNGNMRRPNGIVKEYHDNYENDENEDSV
ncbi:hypothetical protein RRG08_005547 [Elysia crispata]|uniref:acid phosphatase n=1 Tax=Elysia crispata TaxID=231223 RepID=A0AAE1AKB2_9GAST|nr:hypothetical protein RRG08_005547 [Elysia crispata]